MPGHEAYGISGAPTLFCNDLLASFDGYAGDDADGNGWKVTTSHLVKALGFLCDKRGQHAPRQSSPADNIVDFALHELGNGALPVCDVYVGCRPSLHNESAVLGCAKSDGTPVDGRLVPSDKEWELSFPAGF